MSELRGLRHRDGRKDEGKSAASKVQVDLVFARRLGMMLFHISKAFSHACNSKNWQNHHTWCFLP